MKTQDVSRSGLAKLAFNRIETEDLLGCSPSTVDRLTQRGLLRPSRAYRRALYSLKEVERFLRESQDLKEVVP